MYNGFLPLTLNNIINNEVGKRGDSEKKSLPYQSSRHREQKQQITSQRATAVVGSDADTDNGTVYLLFDEFERKNKQMNERTNKRVVTDARCSIIHIYIYIWPGDHFECRRERRKAKNENTGKVERIGRNENNVVRVLCGPVLNQT